MRLVACAFSAVLLSGCSWMGFGGGSNHATGQYGSQYGAQYSSQYEQYEGGKYKQQAPRSQLGPCQIMSASQPIPRGCRPEQVTLALGGGNGQAQAPQYANGGYGSHAGNAHQASAQYQPSRQQRKPKLRGALGFEIDHSLNGEMYQPLTSPVYNRADFAEGFESGTQINGTHFQTEYTSVPERVIAPNISFDDVYNAPFRLTGGLEYIFSDHATVFANAGYTRAEGSTGGGVEVIDQAQKIETETVYDAMGVAVSSTSNTTFIPNQTVARFTYDFNELERIDFELGGRYYFNPIMQDKLERPLTPFVAASGGAAYYSETTVTENQRQRFLGRIFEGGQQNPDGDYYDVSFGAPQTIYEAQWVPYGALKAGVEWQMTPRTALAFEAGLKYEGARDPFGHPSNDANISVPMAIRGSYNF